MSLANHLIEQLGLLPHPEGGYYKQTYCSNEQIPHNALPNRFSGSRPYATAIYFLLQQEDFSAFHRIKSDECWHFYAGNTLFIHILPPNGNLYTITLGSELNEGQVFQAVVPAGCWFASEPAKSADFCLVGCTVAPGFDFLDFELAKSDELIAQFPQHAQLIKRLCRQ